jgi:hypothetical protein
MKNHGGYKKKMTKPVAHATADARAWRRNWLTNRKPQAMANGAQAADEVDLKVTHDVIDPDKFAKHVAKMEKDGKRKEMGAQNSPL